MPERSKNLLNICKHFIIRDIYESVGSVVSEERVSVQFVSEELRYVESLIEKLCT